MSLLVKIWDVVPKAIGCLVSPGLCSLVLSLNKHSLRALAMQAMPDTKEGYIGEKRGSCSSSASVTQKGELDL